MSKKRKHLRREREVLRSLAASWLVLRLQRAEERSLTVSIVATCCSLSLRQDGGEAVESGSCSPTAALALESTPLLWDAPTISYNQDCLIRTREVAVADKLSVILSFVCNSRPVDDSGCVENNTT